MKVKTFLAAFLLVVFTGLIGGCHELASNDYNEYGTRSDSYRDGVRDGRANERRRDDRRNSRYYDRYDRSDYHRRR